MAIETTPLEYITKFVHAREEKPRWALFALKSAAQELLPDNRVKICFHHRLPNHADVEIWYNADRASAHYRGLMKCGQGWICPVCAQRLALVRKAQLRLAMDNARALYLPLLVTYTCQHYTGMPLKRCLQGMTDAYREMRHQRIWGTYKDEYLIQGETRATEITYGASGWHPHFHVILWLSLDVLLYIKTEAGDYRISDITNALENHLTNLWLECLAKFKLTGERGPVLNVRSGWDTLDDYVTKSGSVLPASGEKWGIAEEVTMGQLKKSHADGKTPWDLLIEYFCGIPSSGELFQEYVEATRGKSSLQWTPGLKARLGVDTDETAEVLTDEEYPGDILLLTLSVDEWRAVVNTQAIGILLDTASKGDPKMVTDFMKRVWEKNEGQKVDDMI